jgi:hypothetical protein
LNVPLNGRRAEMSKNKPLFLLVTSAATLIFPCCLSRAASDCVTEPKPSPSTHWKYHVDPVTHQKCWFVASSTEAPRSAPPLQVSPKDVHTRASVNRDNASIPEQRTKAGISSTPNRETANATSGADCEMQALKVFDEEKQTFLKQCLSASAR